MLRVLTDWSQRRLLTAAPVKGVRAARMELAAGGKIDEARRLAGYRKEPLPVITICRERTEKPLGVGVMVLVEDLIAVT
jgi:hypothetical protein